MIRPDVLKFRLIASTEKPDIVDDISKKIEQLRKEKKHLKEMAKPTIEELKEKKRTDLKVI